MKKIEIKPNSQEYVGKKVTCSNWNEGEYVTIKHVSDKEFFALDGHGVGVIRNNKRHDNIPWLLFEEPEQQVYLTKQDFVEALEKTYQDYTSCYDAIDNKIINLLRVVFNNLPDRK